MLRVLLTAFEPYDHWPANASWMLVQRLARDLPAEPLVTTRLYPVDFSLLRQRLESDLRDNYDVALMIGQAPGYTAVEFEAIGVNVGMPHGASAEDATPLAADGPVAYQSSLPLADWAGQLRDAGVPARVSFHAGTFLCNAALYLAHYFIERMSLPTQAAFVHVPLDPSQVVDEPRPVASTPVETSASAVAKVLNLLQDRPVA